MSTQKKLHLNLFKVVLATTIHSQT